MLLVSRLSVYLYAYTHLGVADYDDNVYKCIYKNIQMDNKQKSYERKK